MCLDLETLKKSITAKHQLEKIEKLITIIGVLKNQYSQIKEFELWSDKNLNKFEKNEEEFNNLLEKYQFSNEFRINLTPNSTICFPLIKTCDTYFRNNVLINFSKLIKKVLSPKKSTAKKEEYILLFQIYVIPSFKNI